MGASALPVEVSRQVEGVGVGWIWSAYNLFMLAVVVLILLDVPQSDFMGAIRSNVHQTVLLCAIALMSAVGFGLWLTPKILKPIKVLAGSSQPGLCRR